MKNILIAKAASIAIFISSASSTTALADWKFTRWGMSVEQTLEAASQQPEKLTLISQSMADRQGNTPRLAFEKTRILGLDFSGSLDFRKIDGKLMKITLCIIENASFGDYERRMVVDELERSLGRPAKIDHTNIRTLAVWRDPTRNNIITASLALPDASNQLPSCLTYEPIRPPSDF